MGCPFHWSFASVMAGLLALSDLNWNPNGFTKLGPNPRAHPCFGRAWQQTASAVPWAPAAAPLDLIRPSARRFAKAPRRPAEPLIQKLHKASGADIVEISRSDSGLSSFETLSDCGLKSPHRRS